MRLIPFLLLFWMCFKTLHGQQSDDSLRVVELDELVYTYNISESKGDLINIYKSSALSSIDEINARLPGIALISRGAYAREPQMSGFSSGQINLTIDGMHIFGACTDKMDPITSYIEPENLESIEAEQGTNSCESGCNVGGAMNMKTKAPVFDTLSSFRMNAGTGFSTVSNGKNVFLTTGQSNDKFGVRVTGFYRKQDCYTDGLGQTIPYSQFQKMNFGVSAKYKTHGEGEIKADMILDEARNIGYSALPMDVGRASAGIYGLEYTKAKSGSLLHSFRAKLYYNSIYHVMDDSKRDSTFLLLPNEQGKSDTVYMHMDMPGCSSTLGGFAEGRLRTGNNSFVFLHADNYLNSSRANMTMYMSNSAHVAEPPMYMETWPDTRRSVTGLFVRFVMYRFRGLKWETNFRSDFAFTEVLSETGINQFAVFNYDVSKPFRKIVFGINSDIEYSITRSLSLTTGMGYGERLPTVSEQFGFYLYNALDEYDYLGNPGLRCEKSIQARAGLNYAFKHFSLNWKVYLNHVNDYVMGVYSSTIPPLNFYSKGLKTYSNIPSAQLAGIDMSIQWAVISNLSLNTIVKAVYAETTKNKPLPQIPPVNVLFMFNYKLKSLNLQGEANYADNQNRIDASFGEQTTPSFLVFNLRAKYILSYGKTSLEFNIALENLLNNAYREHLDWGNYLRPGRNLTFQVVVGF